MERDVTQDSKSANFDAVKDELGETVSKSKDSATRALHDAKDEISRKAAEYASEAKDALLESADGVQGNIGSRLAAFGGALRAASEHLANSDQRPASKFVLDAAGGLEKLSGSLQNKSFEEVLDEVRSFGRDNATALMAGSVVAGLALGRLFKTGNTDDAQNVRQETDSPAYDTAALDDPNDGWVSPEGSR